MPSDTKDLQITPIIGLEIHVQLLTRTKMFCGCPLTFEAPPNSAVCPVCLGHPGSLPVLNRRAFELGLTTGLALSCEIGKRTKWDRKSYYYPDMPKDYQISQYDMPLCGPGTFEFPVGGDMRGVRIRRAHLEEDAGKNIHDAPGGTLVDLNRAGTPLLEIVTEPDIQSAEEAYAFCTELQRLVVYLEVSEGVMKKGQMRFEPNVNLAITKEGVEYRTPIAEIKNLNSFRAVRNAVAYEIERQAAAWLDDHDYVLGTASNENRGWDDGRGVTEYQRPKEAAHDYRYFPDPDLVPAVINDDLLRSAREALPELPLARRKRFVDQLGLDPKDADVIIGDRASADLFEATLTAGAPAATIAKQFVNTWQKLASDLGKSVADLGVNAGNMAQLAVMTAEGKINSTAVARIAPAMMQQDQEPLELAQSMSLLQVSDDRTLQTWIEQVFAENDSALDDLRKNPGKSKAVAGFLRGQVMKLSGGKADPRAVGKVLDQKITEILNAQT